MSSRGRRQRQEDPLVKLSKQMTFLLRHGAIKEGVPIDDKGFIDVDDLLAWRPVAQNSWKRQDVVSVVENCPKKRFFLEKRGGDKLFIRANQGHTIDSDLVQVELKELRQEDLQNTEVIHGTTFAAWELIKGTGLNKMARVHIHFARSFQGGEISGARSNSSVLIYIDPIQALKDGCIFYESQNGVILTEGFNGVLPTKYFLKVVNRKTGESLLGF